MPTDNQKQPTKPPLVDAIPLRNRFAALREMHPLPPATGKVADKAFFDQLSGE
jgi:hypothetical protein